MLYTVTAALVFYFRMPKGRKKIARPQRQRQRPARLRSTTPESVASDIAPPRLASPSPNGELAEVASSLQRMMQQQQDMFAATLASLQDTIARLQPPANPSISSTASVVSPPAPQPSSSTTSSVASQPTAQPTAPPGESNIYLPILPSQPVTPRPVRSVTTTIGMNVPLHIKQKVWDHKYVDLAELLNPNDTPAYALSISDPNSLNPQLSLAPKKKQQLTQTEWGAAMDIFVAVYLQRYPAEAGEILTYVKSVKDLMQEDADWAYYDFHYRTEREWTKMSWTTCDPNLEAKARYRAQKALVTAAPNRQPQPFRAPQQKPRGVTTLSTPYGYCFDYHDRSLTCRRKQCPYKHTCYACNKAHPYFRCGSNSNKRDSAATKPPRTTDRQSDKHQSPN